MGGAVFVGTLQLQHDLAGAVTFEPFVGDGRPGDIAAELLEFLALIGAPAHCRMEAKAVRIDAQLWGGRPGSARQALQAQCDPVTLGFVASLARPGGNITGITSISQQLVGKRLELLKEVVPQPSQVGMLLNPENPFSESNLKEMEDAARALAVKPQMMEVRDGNDLDRAFSAMRQARIRAFAVAPGGFFTTNLDGSWSWRQKIDCRRFIMAGSM
jgi:ABC transporter substrate binding protein